MDEMIMNLRSYEESLIGGLMDADEVNEIIAEMKNAKVGTIKPDCWEKISDTEFKIYVL